MRLGHLSREPAFKSLDQKVNKEVVFDKEFNNRVDKTVEAIQSEEDEAKKKELFDILITHIHRTLLRHVNIFYASNEDMMIKHGFAREDLYNSAVEAIMEFVYKWDNKQTRLAEGEIPALFTTYFFKGLVLEHYLKRKFIIPFLALMRKAETVSINQGGHITDVEEGANKEVSADFQERLIDPDAENALESMLNRENRKVIEDTILNEVFREDPLLSLMVIVKYGLNLEKEWREKFDAYAKSNEGLSEAYFAKVFALLDAYNDQGMTFQEIGDLHGLSRERINQKIQSALRILRRKINKYDYEEDEY